jgi:hypothetical protein
MALAGLLVGDGAHQGVDDLAILALQENGGDRVLEG